MLWRPMRRGKRVDLAQNTLLRADPHRAIWGFESDAMAVCCMCNREMDPSYGILWSKMSVQISTLQMDTRQGRHAAITRQQGSTAIQKP